MFWNLGVIRILGSKNAKKPPTQQQPPTTILYLPFSIAKILETKKLKVGKSEIL